MPSILDTILLLALPASGKSEVRRYLKKLDPATCRRDFHMGATLQLDDFPYVHFMRRIDEELDALGKPRLFFHSPEHPFRHGTDWGTLIELLNEDHANLLARKHPAPASWADHLFRRLEAAAVKAGAPARLSGLDEGTRSAAAKKLEGESREFHEKLVAAYPATLEGHTLVIEFARGGADGAAMPLAAPYGYAHSLATLSDAILERASILYVWVTPEESRRKNEARTDPNDPGSILHHGVPIEVMMKEYGCDDMDWLEASSGAPGTVAVETRGRTFHLPVARFDNRVDKTSFLRLDREDWKPADVKAVHEGLRTALHSLIEREKLR